MIRTENGLPCRQSWTRCDRKIIQMEIEEAALKKEEDELSKARLAELQKELAEKRDAFNAMNAQLGKRKDCNWSGAAAAGKDRADLSRQR